MAACKSGSAKRMNVQTRVRLMGDALDNGVNVEISHRASRKSKKK
jgi:hypothetical protein